MGYKRLGDYIQQVNVRNTALEVDTLLGVSITKKLIPSIANTIGTNMSVYKIIERQQFAYGTVTSRNGDKISIALADEHDKALVSQIYVVFEVIDKEELLPEYLMMWFSRPEFDRYARYHSHGSTRETFDWDDMCEVQLPIPSIDKQRAIVAEYQSIENKIIINNQICEKLEATAQALYRHWFVDFEFPNEDGKPYKSSGGAMVYNEELDKEIPEGWGVGSFESSLNFKTGKLDSNAATEDGNYPFFTCSEEIFTIDTYSFDQEAVLLGGNNATGKFPLKYYDGKFDAYQRTYVIDSAHPQISNKQIYYRIKGLLNEMRDSSVGTTTKFLTMKIFNPIPIIIPNLQIKESFESNIQIIYNQKQFFKLQNKLFICTQSLLLSRLAQQL